MDRDISLRYKPKKGFKLNYQITYNVVGERKGTVILDSSLNIGFTWKVLESSENDNSSVLFTVDRASFISNNTEKKTLLPGEEVLLIFSSNGKLIDRKGDIPCGFVDFFNYSFPSESIRIASLWDSICYVIFPNMKNPVEISGKFKFERFQGYKGYNCSHISFDFQEKVITLPSFMRQTLSGNGYILFDPSYSISPFTCINTICDTGETGLLFRGTFKQEIGPFSGAIKNTSVPITVSEEYFTRY